VSTKVDVATNGLRRVNGQFQDALLLTSLIRRPGLKNQKDTDWFHCLLRTRLHKDLSHTTLHKTLFLHVEQNV
jgi:hypothetical protein